MNTITTLKVVKIQLQLAIYYEQK